MRACGLRACGLLRAGMRMPGLADCGAILAAPAGTSTTAEPPPPETAGVADSGRCDSGRAGVMAGLGAGAGAGDPGAARGVGVTGWPGGVAGTLVSAGTGGMDGTGGGEEGATPAGGAGAPLVGPFAGFMPVGKTPPPERPGTPDGVLPATVGAEAAVDGGAGALLYTSAVCAWLRADSSIATPPKRLNKVRMEFPLPDQTGAARCSYSKDQGIRGEFNP